MWKDGRFALKYKGSNGANGAISTWKSSLSKVNTMSNYCILASRTYTILVGVGDLMGPLLSTKATTKCIWIDIMCLCAAFLAFIITEIVGLNS
jgi:hypothetical protein